MPQSLWCDYTATNDAAHWAGRELPVSCLSPSPETHRADTGPPVRHPSRRLRAIPRDNLLGQIDEGAQARSHVAASWIIEAISGIRGRPLAQDFNQPACGDVVSNDPLAYVGKADTGPARLRDQVGLIECEGPRHIDPHRFAATFKLPAVESAAGKTRADAFMIHQVARRRSLPLGVDRKSTRLNSSHQIISYAVFCLKKKNNTKSIS